MELLLSLLILLVSLAVLAKSSSVVVNNAAKLSKFFGISQLSIGFLLIAVSTSLPELLVSVISSGRGEGAIAAGNVFGSNIANILLVIGLGAFLYGLKIKRKELKDISIILVLTTIISVYIIFNSSVRGQALGLSEGILLLALFGGYAAYILSRKGPGEEVTAIGVTKEEALKAFLFFFGSIILVLLSANFVVESAVNVARMLNIAESFIGATIIAVGTSLPELAIDLQAIRKKQYGLALGDAIGSNMVNITLVLGTAAVINPIHVLLPVFIAALLFAIIANVILFYVAAVPQKLKRLGGASFLAVYAIYVAVIFYLQLGEMV